VGAPKRWIGGRAVNLVPKSNVQVLLRERPLDRVEPSHFNVVESPVPSVGVGQVLVRVCWLAFAPAQRGVLNDVPSYTPPVQIGEVMRSSAVGQIVASRHPDFAVGDNVMGSFGWQEHALLSPDNQVDGLSDIEKLAVGVDLRLALNVLGVTGLTAYIGMVDLGRPAAGDTVLVTAAAGATGSIAGQVARLRGAARVIGTASTPEKRAWVVDELGFDDCLDYRDPKIFRLLRAAAPNGYNVVFDNVGGSLLDDALGNIALRARVVLCGAISTGYKPQRAEVGLRNYQFLTTRRGTMAGFIVRDHADRFDEARADLARWTDSGELRHAEDMVVGLEHAPAALQGLFDGKNLGKQLLHVADALPAEAFT
jgi:NADPH-dependent curcumin reductase